MSSPKVKVVPTRERFIVRVQTATEGGGKAWLDSGPLMHDEAKRQAAEHIEMGRKAKVARVQVEVARRRPRPEALPMFDEKWFARKTRGGAGCD